MTNNIPIKQAVENGLQQQLQEKGLTVEKVLTYFHPIPATRPVQKEH
jgi:hypothetical protein